jgi:hypothetical protein
MSLLLEIVYNIKRNLLNKSYALYIFFGIITNYHLLAMQPSHDNPPHHCAIPAETENDFWKTKLTFDHAETIAQFLTVESKKAARLVCKNWHQQFRHPAQSYGNGEHLPVELFRQHHDVPIPYHQYLFNFINNRPQQRPDDSFELLIRHPKLFTTQDQTPDEIERFFTLLYTSKLIHLIKKITSINIPPPPTIAYCQHLSNLEAYILGQDSLKALQQIDWCHFNHVEHLTMNYLCDTVSLTEPFLQKFLQLPSLKKLIAYSLYIPESFLFVILGALKNLSVLSICFEEEEDFDKFNEKQFYDLDALRRGALINQQVRSLRISQLPATPWFSYRLAYQAPNLKTLSIGSGHQGLQDLFRFKHLATLNIDVLEHEHALQTILSQELVLKKLIIGGYIKHQLFTESEKLHNLPFLKKLEISGGWGIDGQIAPSALTLIAHCPHLEKLSIFIGDAFPSDTFITILESLHYLKELEIYWLRVDNIFENPLLKKFIETHPEIAIRTCIKE